MRVLVKRGYSLVNDLHFESGPVYIGRRPGSHIYLPDRGVSRQHAVLFTTASDSWVVQDLESANRTTVNGRAITKMPLREGDIVGIADFVLEIHFEQSVEDFHLDTPLDLSDTIVETDTSRGAPIQVRPPDQPLRIAAIRLRDFYQLVVNLVTQNDEEALIDEVCNYLLGQFRAMHVWVGLRETNSGPLTCHGGRDIECHRIGLEELPGKKILKQAIENESYVLAPNVAESASPADSQFPGLQTMRSAMAAPIVTPAGIFGVLYVDNHLENAAYTVQDLDYLMLVTTVLAAVAENIG